METCLKPALEGPVCAASGGPAGATEVAGLAGLAWLPAAGGALAEGPELALARAAARSLYEWLAAEADPDHLRALARRILVHAGPVLAFQPEDGWEAASALAWARGHRVRVTSRGAAAAPVPGSRARRCRLLLDFSRVTAIGVDARRRLALVGAGARLGQVQEKLAASGLSLPSRPPDPDATLGAWLAGGGLGQRLFAHGTCVEHLRAVEAALPQGVHVRVHQDGSLDLLDDPRAEVRHLDPPQAAAWFSGAGLPHLKPADFARRAGRPGAVVSVLLEVGSDLPVSPHLVPFPSRGLALRFARNVAEEAERVGRLPADLEVLSPAALEPARAAWAEAGSLPADYRDAPGGYVYLDFEEAAAEELLRSPSLTGPLGLQMPATAARLLEERSRPPDPAAPGPAAPALQVLLKLDALPGYLKAVERLARWSRIPLRWEVRHLRRGRALVRLDRTTEPAGPARLPQRLVAGSLFIALAQLAVIHFNGVPARGGALPLGPRNVI
ncbi:MAG TPA: FAD-binding protein [Candidatus Saccharimonadales bacterium]|nr:FAD-binding protein [Candidatus Saccharimonadales bacterium]